MSLRSKIVDISQLSLKILKILGYRRFRNILDIGCGKGKFTSAIKKVYKNAHILGIDISETAINAAKSRYPDIIFKTLDITKTPFNYSKYDCIFVTEIIWYVLPYLENIFSEINKGLRESKGIFVLNNHLYQNSEQKYGREFITTIETLLSKLPFKILYTIENNRFENYDITIIGKALDSG